MSPRPRTLKSVSESAFVISMNIGRWALSKTSKHRYFNGARIRVPLAVGKAYWNPYSENVYETEEWEAIEIFGKRGWTYVDVGANIGILAVKMSRTAGPDGSVIACEPNPSTYGLLLETLRMNSCLNTTPLQTVLMDAAGAIPFNISPHGGLGVRSSVAYSDPGSRTVVLPATTIDILIEKSGRLDFLKIDAEGAELSILKGSRASLDKFQPLVQVEVHGQYLPKLGASANDVFEFMAARGYFAYNLTTRAVTDAEEFMTCTHSHVKDDFTGEDVGYQGYGQVLFVPQARAGILKNIPPRPCVRCGRA